MEWNFPDKLKSLRESKGYSQDDLGKIIGKSRGSFSNYERGIAQPTLKDLTNLCEILEVTPNDLLLDSSYITQVEENGSVYKKVRSNVQRHLPGNFMNGNGSDDLVIEHWPMLPDRTPRGQMWQVFQLETTAMEPRIPSMSFLCCELATSINDDFVYVIRFRDGSLKCNAIRKNRRSDSPHFGKLELLSYSTIYTPQTISEDEIEELFRVVKVMAEIKL